MRKIQAACNNAPRVRLLCTFLSLSAYLNLSRALSTRASHAPNSAIRLSPRGLAGQYSTCLIHSSPHSSTSSFHYLSTPLSNGLNMFTLSSNKPLHLVLSILNTDRKIKTKCTNNGDINFNAYRL